MNVQKQHSISERKCVSGFGKQYRMTLIFLQHGAKSESAPFQWQLGKCVFCAVLPGLNRGIAHSRVKSGESENEIH